MILAVKDAHDWIARAAALAPMIEGAADRTEKERKIPADVLSAMHAAGLFHMLLPVSLGGSAVWRAQCPGRLGPAQIGRAHV